MLIKNMEYLSQRLRCTDAEKDACLETVTVLLHFWTDVRKNGVLAIGGDHADQNPNPFFRTCLHDAIELVSTDDELLLEDLFAQYLIAGDYTGAGFLQNVVIAEGILAYLKFLHGHEDGGSFQQWGDRQSVAVGDTSVWNTGKSSVKPSAGRFGSGNGRSKRLPSCRNLTPSRSFPSHCAKSCSAMGLIMIVLLRLP